MCLCIHMPHRRTTRWSVFFIVGAGLRNHFGKLERVKQMEEYNRSGFHKEVVISRFLRKNSKYQVLIKGNTIDDYEVRL